MALSSPRQVRHLKKPCRLTPGDTVLILAPASPPGDPTLFKRAKKYLSSLGYQVVFGAHAKERLGFLAGNDRKRALDLNQAFRSNTVRAIFCVRGGYGTGRILSKLDFRALQERPKILVGCSDITALLCGVLVESRVSSFHAPTLQSLMDSDCPAFTRKSLIAQLSGSEEGLGSIAAMGKGLRENIECVNPGRATGIMVGGNLSILQSLIGTRFLPSFAGSILCLEDVGEAPYRVDRVLTHFLNTGMLERVNGFALGTFDKCSYTPHEARSKQSLRDVIIDRLRPLRKPIVMGLPFGHIAHNSTLPLGVAATIDARHGDLIIEELGVR